MQYTFSFCATKAAEMSLCTLECSFFFVPPKKNEPRKRRPPETPIPLRMPVMAKWAKLATLKQTPIFNAMPFILIVRQSRPTSHSRNGAACRQMQTIMDSCMLENHLSFNPLFIYASNISTCFFFAIVHDKVVLLIALA